MRFPSIDALYQRARAVLLRFPWPIVAGVVAATAAIIGSDSHNSIREEFWARLCLVALMAIPLTFAISLLAEWRRWAGILRTSVLAAAIVALYWFFWTWPGPEQKHLVLRYLQLSAAIHLAAAFLPFWGRAESPAFWQYNRKLFEGFLRAVLFSGVLFLGLAIALGALDKLFGVDLEGETYIRLWFVCAFVINTWIFLAAVPEDLDEQEAWENYPKPLKVFTQYILTPLVAVYLVILTAYLVKIVITGTWPSGWIGYLVSSVAAVGILGFLLVHPLRSRQDEAWIRTFSRWLFVGLIPAAGMFLLALWKRVDPYGLTELRFLGLLLGAWLLGIALLYTVRRETGIRIIPVSLAIILLLTAFGPLGSTAMSVRSQANRIREIIRSNGIGVVESAAGGPATVNDDDRREMSEALRFLLERNALGSVRGIFGDNAGIPADFDPNEYGEVDSTASAVMRSFGVEYMARYYYEQADYFSVEREVDGETRSISGFDYVVELRGSSATRVQLGGDTLRVISDSSRMSIVLRRSADTLLVFELKPVVDTLFALEPAARDQVPLELTVEANQVRGMLVLRWLSAERREGVVKVTSWRGELYLSLPRQSF